MKKTLYILIATIAIFGSSKQVYAANMVSNMALANGGQSVAECAKSMDKGISECVKALECAK